MRFRDVGLTEVADDEPLGEDTFASYAEAGRSWSALDECGEPVGYVLVDDVDGATHVAQISVHPAHQGAGVARALLDQVEARARAQGQCSVTLTTFDDVPWNRPLYEHLGFAVVSDGEMGPELRSVRAAEATAGLDPARRVCMRRRLEA